MDRVLARRRPGNPGVEEGRHSQRDQEDGRSEEKQSRKRSGGGGEELLQEEHGHENLRDRASCLSLRPISIAPRGAAVRRMTVVA